MTASIAGPEFFFFGDTTADSTFLLFSLLLLRLRGSRDTQHLFKFDSYLLCVLHEAMAMLCFICILADQARAINGDPSYIDQGTKRKKVGTGTALHFCFYYYRELPQYLTYQALLSRLLLHFITSSSIKHFIPLVTLGAVSKLLDSLMAASVRRRSAIIE